eukprot:TRINITY_DN23225_c0_g1_i1.p1 TRINITY_DN23225_c0_g1~~TRINITY_DN23225_c0_g1_i1.p1  ORF type:complete len:269 (-),score=15.23 TRINITY_DN23225_c0_g1_i1:342-1148(-)
MAEDNALVPVVVCSLAGEEVLRASRHLTATVGSVRDDVAAALRVPASNVQLYLGDVLLKKSARLGKHLSPFKEALELTCLLSACVFQLATFTGRETFCNTQLLSYPWTPDYDPAEAIAIVCWVKTLREGYHYLLSRGEWTEGYSLGVLPSSDHRGGIRGCLGMPVDWTDFVSKTAIRPGNWYHVALTFDGEVAELYVNGVVENSKRIEARLESAYEPWRDLFIGGEACRPGRTHSYRNFLCGEMRGLRIHAETLSAEYLQADFARGVC